MEFPKLGEVEEDEDEPVREVEEDERLVAKSRD